jgi:hypothetical protein
MADTSLIAVIQLILAFTIALPCVGLALVGAAQRPPKL